MSDAHTERGTLFPPRRWAYFLFSRSLSPRFHRGDVLVTTATGVMSEEEGERWGLVPTHAYAVLDIRDYKVGILSVVSGDLGVWIEMVLMVHRGA